MKDYPLIPLTELSKPKQWKTLSKTQLIETGYPVYGANGKIGFSDKYSHKNPTLLIGCRGSCGSLHISEPFSYVNGNAMAVDDLDESKISLKFLYYFLKQRGFRDVITGTSQPQIIKQNLARILVPTPPLHEQKRIAEALDKADALREKRRLALQKLDTLLQSVFLEMFGDPFRLSNESTVHFRELVKRITYGFTCPMKHLDEGIPILTAKNVKDGFIDFDNVHYADKAEFDALTAKSKPKYGDILITKDGTIGRSAIVNVDFPICINQSVALVETDQNKVSSDYLIGYLLSPSVQRKLKNMGKGNALQHLQITELARLPIVVPSINEQERYKEIREKILHQYTVSEFSSLRLDNLFQSLQQRAFKGDLFSNTSLAVAPQEEKSWQQTSLF